MIDTLLWIFLLAVTLGVGIYVGYQIRLAYGPKTPARLHRDYLKGLNFLLNEQPDKAVEIFIKMLQVDKDTVETHVALGNLFRRRGEVDRALRIHQNLIERGNLDTEQRVSALFELGQDYLSAGMFDRAEHQFCEVMTLDDDHVVALQCLLDIYSQEKNWMNAIAVAKKYELATGKPMQSVVAHFYCEEAEVLYSKKNTVAALEALRQALTFDARCVRASLLEGQYFLAEKDYKAALNSLQRIQSQDIVFLAEATEMIVQCYEALQNEKGLLYYLKRTIKKHPQVPFVLVLAHRIQRWRGDESAARFVADFVHRYPSFRGLQLLIDLHLPTLEGNAKADLTLMRQLVDVALKNKPRYRCGHCGFAGRLLHWQCLGCKRWGTMKPIQGIEVGAG